MKAKTGHPKFSVFVIKRMFFVLLQKLKLPVKGILTFGLIINKNK